MIWQKYQSSVLTTDGIRLNMLIWWQNKNYYVGLDEVGTWINEENIRLYFLGYESSRGVAN